MRDPTSFMRRAITIAKRARGKANPNPTVGSVIVKNGQIVGEGVTSAIGGPHAETNALMQAGSSAKNAELYVTLEPCSFHGRTPPCCEAIVQAGIAKVYCALRDPDKRVSGQGLKYLRQQDIKVDVGLLKEEAKDLHATYLTHRKNGRPHFVLKLAQSLDGQIATYSGDSKWITGIKARRHVHRWRSFVDAVVIGANTLNLDNPKLTVRHVDGRNPRPIVVDGRLNSNPEASLFSRPGTILATGKNTSMSKRHAIALTGTEIWTFSTNNGVIDLNDFARRAGENNIVSAIVEGGGQLATAFLKAQLIDNIHIYQAPRILGKGVSGIGELNIKLIAESLKLREVNTRRLGADILYSAKVEYPCLLG
ncbi:MAG: bifunctional diaminohydroxyphosphoribosylaminopyrimidine deaminase/5-amino-6-(5-phosphoribosylamino)uracil reductase RibD [Candidatus Latescibacterota bacterium]|nr:bifunctional diaminohydroxyphosphoribosylaminopyrimidine deaminase/5-amino-6-(5-phosphoribosylamino)uracil reductase RibD [Candidatus Latescibacterota bacterium]